MNVYGLLKEARVSHEEFGALVGVSRQAISSLMSDGALPRDANAGELLLVYCHRLREMAAGRASGIVGGLDLVQERAALARAQRLGVERKNAIASREVASVQLLATVLGTASATVAGQMEALPARLRRECPDLPASVLDVIASTMAGARSDWIAEVERGVRVVLTGQMPGEDDGLEALDEEGDERA